MRQRLEKLIESPQYLRLRIDISDPQLDPRIKAVRRVVDGYREAAKKKLLQEHPELLTQVRERAKDEAEASRIRQSGSYDALSRLGQ